MVMVFLKLLSLPKKSATLSENSLSDLSCLPVPRFVQTRLVFIWKALKDSGFLENGVLVNMVLQKFVESTRVWIVQSILPLKERCERNNLGFFVIGRQLSPPKNRRDES
jgi:hypothetical protein